MTTAALETPWTREGSVIKSKFGAVVACVSDVSVPQRAEADADFIVRACNAQADRDIDMKATEWRAAILRCAANAHKDAPEDTSMRTRMFVARLIGALCGQNEPGVKQALEALLATPPADPGEEPK